MFESLDIISTLHYIRSLNNFSEMYENIIKFSILLSKYSNKTGLDQDYELSDQFEVDSLVFKCIRRLRNDLVHYNKNAKYKYYLYNVDNNYFIDYNKNDIIKGIHLRLDDIISII